MGTIIYLYNRTCNEHVKIMSKDMVNCAGWVRDMVNNGKRWHSYDNVVFLRSHFTPYLEHILSSEIPFAE